MPKCKPAFACLLLFACAGAFADDADGTLTRQKQKTPMTAVYAGMTMTELGSGVVVFTDRPQASESVSFEPGREPETIAAELNRKGAQVVVLKVLRDLTPMLWVCADGCQQSIPFDEKSVRLSLTRYDDEAIEGTVKGAGSKNGIAADLKFALDLHNVAEAGASQGASYAHAPLTSLALLPAPERPATPSAVYSDGIAYGLADSYAFAAQDEFNRDARNRGRPVLVFTDAPMDKAALAGPGGAMSALHEQQSAGKIKHVLVLRLLADGKVFIDLRGDEPTYAALGDDSQVLKLQRNDGKRVEGSYTCKDPNEKRMQDHLCFDLQFALDVVQSR
jgi:hypothetical protein